MCEMCFAGAQVFALINLCRSSLFWEWNNFSSDWELLQVFMHIYMYVRVYLCVFCWDYSLQTFNRFALVSLVCHQCVIRVSGGIKTRLGSKGAIFYLPAAGGFGSGTRFYSHFSLGEAAQWSRLAICTGRAVGQVALAGGKWVQPQESLKAHWAAGNWNGLA